MPPAGRPPTEAAARIGDTGFAPTFLRLRPACHARSRRVGRAGVPAVGASARSCCSRLTRVVSSFSWPCGFNHNPTGLFLVIPGVLKVGRRCRDGGRGRCARRKVDGEEKRRQELRLRAAVQNKTLKPLPTPERACPGEVKPKPPPAGPTREMYQVSWRFEQFRKNMFHFGPNDP